MGKVVVEGGGSRVVVVDAWMVKQTNSGSETEMDADDFGKIMFQKKDVPGSWYFWWHSHAGMPVFWSGTDKDQIAKLANNGACVALVLNTRGESKLCLAVGKPFLLFMDDVKIDVIDPTITPDTRKEWDAEYDAKVSARYSYSGHGWMGEAGNWWSDGDSAWPVSDRATHRSVDQDRDFHGRFRSSTHSAVGQSRTEIARGSNQAEQEEARSRKGKLERKDVEAFLVDNSAADLAWARLEDIEKDNQILDYTLRERKITKRFCDIIGVAHEADLEIDSIMSEGAEKGMDLEQMALAKQAELFEEEDVIDTALTRYMASRNFDKLTKKEGV